MRSLQGQWGLPSGTPCQPLLQIMFHVFKTWKFSAQCPHPAGVMVPARVSILGHCITGVHPYMHPGLGANVCKRMLMERGCITKAVCPPPCKDLVGQNGTKGGKRKVQNGASFPHPSSSSPGHRASSGPAWSSDHCEGVCGDAEWGNVFQVSLLCCTCMLSCVWLFETPWTAVH